MIVFTEWDSYTGQYASFIVPTDGFPNVKAKPLLPATCCFEIISFLSSKYFIQFRESTIKESNSLPNARVFELTTDQQQPTLVKAYGNAGKYIWMDWDIHNKRIYLLEKNPEKITTLLNDLILNPLRKSDVTLSKPKKECTLYIINPQDRLDDPEVYQVELELTETISARQVRTTCDYRIRPIFSKLFSVVRMDQVFGKSILYC